jgi:hypothetical protein
MGQDVHQDWAIPVDTIHALVRVLEKEWGRALDWTHRHQLASVGAYTVIAFCGLFEGVGSSSPIFFGS